MTTDGLLPPVRIVVVLTGAEAAALGRWHGNGDVEAIRALAKIGTALEHAVADADKPAAPTSGIPPLRAKAYRPRTEPLRMAKATLLPKGPATAAAGSAAPAPELDDYVPFRDEADGIYT